MTVCHIVWKLRFRDPALLVTAGWLVVAVASVPFCFPFRRVFFCRYCHLPALSPQGRHRGFDKVFRS
uniref:Uncharacterized protein n=1 Tax=Anopheles darlingi TaxID=43151 RepID=A0A2M4D6M7_ANODA